MKIIKFPNSPIKCNLKNVDILCYETESCTFESTINFTENTECTAKDIDMIRHSLPIYDDDFSTTIAMVVMSVSILIAIFFILLDISKNGDSTNNATRRRNRNDYAILPSYQEAIISNNYRNGRRDGNNYDILPSYQEAIDTSNENSNNNSNRDSNVELFDDTNIYYQGESESPTSRNFENVNFDFLIQFFFIIMEMFVIN
ncbi:hypothetical protein PIROE2DRAFT_17589 [Piromyces sp. E2]|nr:hypothetical protein PIROE2DRAFT_17589 [Piromyces sp. E2]|eukprot:OUM57437.1 hypothetical protein PIROE2DRAFT_17589 [Piromyces sp. E2]